MLSSTAQKATFQLREVLMTLVSSSTVSKTTLRVYTMPIDNCTTTQSRLLLRDERIDSCDTALECVKVAKNRPAAQPARHPYLTTSALEFNSVKVLPSRREVPRSVQCTSLSQILTTMTHPFRKIVKILGI